MKLVVRQPRIILPTYIPPGTAFSSYIAALNPVAWWRMDDAIGSTKLIDAVAAEQATLQGTYTLGVAGLAAGDTNTAAQFVSGSSCAYTAAGSKWALGSGDYSVIFLAKWTIATLCAPLVVRDSTSTNVMAAFVLNRATGSIEVEAQDGTNLFPWTNAASYNNGSVHVLGMSQSAATKTLRLYVDGTLIGSNHLTNPRPTGSTMNVTIAANVGKNQNFYGTLDEIAMFNKLVTDAQMTDIANIALNGHA